MKKGKFGLVLCLYPILGFVCVILRQPLLCAAVLALAVFLEKDSWAGRQTFQAWVLSLVISFFDNVLTRVAALLHNAFMNNLYFLADFISGLISVVSALVYLAAIVFSIMGILRVMKDEEANLPLLADLAYRIYGQRKPRTAPVPTAPVQSTAPVQPAPPFQPAAGQPQAPNGAAHPQPQVPQQPVQPNGNGVDLP